MTIEAVEKRKPLKDTARRAGWVGSNILLNRLPPDARLYLIHDKEIIPKSKVRNKWSRFEFLKQKRIETKGWLNDILTCIRQLNKPEFTLNEIYAFEQNLKTLHPKNKHIKPKIRQQLQILRDNKIIEFRGRGKYGMIP